MTVNEALSIVYARMAEMGIARSRVSFFEVMEAAREVVKAQGDDPLVPQAKVVAFPRNTQR